MKYLKLFENFNLNEDIIKIANLINGLDLDLAIILSETQNINMDDVIDYLISLVLIPDSKYQEFCDFLEEITYADDAKTLYEAKVYNLDIEITAIRESYEDDSLDFDDEDDSLDFDAEDFCIEIRISSPEIYYETLLYPRNISTGVKDIISLFNEVVTDIISKAMNEIIEKRKESLEY
jgi:hypothetical protein